MIDLAETVTLKVGTSKTSRSGDYSGDMRDVSFVAYEVGSVTDRSDENRPLTQTLYRCNDDRLVVYVENDTRWQGETSTSVLVEVTEADLGYAGRFAQLGAACGYGQAMTLDQALEFSAKILKQQEFAQRQDKWDKLNSVADS